MYIPSHFQIDDTEETYQIIKDNSFATLFSEHDGEPCVTHLPLLFDGRYLYGHFARPNLQWADIEGQTVLAVFHGPHCYISPTWYETNTAVPTWNYVAVHVYGEVELVEREEELLASLDQLVGKYEDPSSSYSLEHIDESYIARLSKGIQGFRINVKKIEGKAKLSQNHSIDRRKKVIEELEKRSSENEKRIASLMKKNIKDS